MKKILYVILALALVFGAGYGYADSNSGPAYGNAIWVGGAGSDVKQPPMEYIRVRYGMCSPNSPTLASGTVVSWDISSADGITVSACIGVSSVGACPRVAGVMVTDMLTDDNTTFDKSDRSFGYMAVRGYCLACVDVSQATAGYTLVPTTATSNPGNFGTNICDGTLQTIVSQDTGILLSEGSADGPMPVIINTR